MCERMRRIDGLSDCHLAFDRQRERETQLGSRHDLSAELYQSASSDGQKERLRHEETEKLTS